MIYTEMMSPNTVINIDKKNVSMNEIDIDIDREDAEQDVEAETLDEECEYFRT